MRSFVVALYGARLPPPQRSVSSCATVFMFLLHPSDSVSLLLATATPYDEVIVKITSPGGAVSDYGLARY